MSKMLRLTRIFSMILVFFSITVFSASATKPESAPTDSTKTATVAQASPEKPATGEVKFPEEQLNGGSEVATEKSDYNPNPKPDATPGINKYVNLILLFVGILFLLVILRLNNVIGLLGDLSGKPAIDWAKWNPRLMMFFLILFLTAGVWETMHDSKWFLPEPASEHGDKIDSMFNITTVFILIVFFLTQFALFYFPYKYRHNPNRRAYFFPHDNKLEIIWTVIPSIVLAILITGGLKAWNSITAPPPTGTVNVEIFAYQFGWTARYPGSDNKLGQHNFRMISAENELGINWKQDESHDDILVKEIHLPVNKNVNFKFRAKDVIHSAYMPYFRAQMNVVPGVPTNFWMKPTKTTLEMRDILRKEGKENTATWDYYLFCNKICGNAHYNMKIKMVIETEAEYNKWLAGQKSGYSKMMEAAAPTPEAPAEAPAADSTKTDKKVALK